MPMKMHDFALPVTSELSLPCGYGTTVVCQFSFLCYVACSVSKSFCFHSNGQHSLPPPEPRLRYGYESNNSDHAIHQCGAWSLGRLVSCRHLFLFFISFCGYIAFVLRSTAIPAVRVTVRTLYSKLTCSYRNLDASVIYICLLYTSPSPRDGLLSRMPSSA